MSGLIHGFAKGLALWGCFFFLLGFAGVWPLAPVRGWKGRLIASVGVIPLSLFYLAREYQPRALATLTETVFCTTYGTINLAALALIYGLAWMWSPARAEPSTG